MVEAWCFGCCQAHLGLLIGFLLLLSSVLFTVEPLSLPFLLSIFWFICSRKWCIDKLGVIHANQTSMCLDPQGEVGAPLNWIKSFSKIFLLTVPRLCFFCGSFMLFLSCYVILSCTLVCWCLVVTCWEMSDLLALICECLIVTLSLSIGILGQVWCLIVSIPDLCPLSYFEIRICSLLLCH